MNYQFVLQLLFSLCLLFGFSLCARYAPTVTTKYGDVRGLIETVDNKDVFVYQGIRYGQAERFELAKMVSPWNGVYDATHYRDQCVELTLPNSYKSPFENKTLTSSEDCLYLNIWRPSRKALIPRAVMVWIHGGRYQRGTIFTNFFDGKYLSQFGNVVVVSLSYRLSVFGFLYGGGAPSAPGNLGLHDLILGLQWIKKNIQFFGGSSSRVTIFGESAGSFAVGSLILSPLAKGLFKRAILQSGSPNSIIATTDKDVAYANTLFIASALSCPTDNATVTMDCLKNSSVEDLIEATAQLNSNTSQNLVAIYGDNVLPIKPEVALVKGNFNRVNIMFGTVRDEGSIFIESDAPFMNPKAGFSLNVDIVNKTLSKAFYMEPNRSNIINYYLQRAPKQDSNSLRKIVIDAISDYFLTCPTVLFAQKMHKRTFSNYNSYRLMVKAPLNMVSSCEDWMGVCHGDDIFYVFGLPFTNLSLYTDEQIQLSQDMMSAWTQFAKNGYVRHFGDGEWRFAFGEKGIKHMNLDPNNYRMTLEHFTENCEKFLKPILFRNL